ncbi:MAG: hypothetical protein WB995_02595, partial [Candidatus Acidiferrales bacterium]
QTKSKPKPNSLISEEMSYIKMHFARNMVTHRAESPALAGAQHLTARTRIDDGAVITKCQ